MTLTRRRLKEILVYDELTGNFRWMEDRGRVSKGDLAGYVNSKKYRYIRIDGKGYRAHRLAWLYVHGKWPKELDHINGIRDDNRLCNLREVTRRQNCQNKACHRNGHIVGANKHRKGYRAQIQIGGVRVSLGTYPTQQESHRAYMAYVKASG